MADDRLEYARALADASYMPVDEYVRRLAESARGANKMRPQVIDAVNTVAWIDRACGMPPVRLVYSRREDNGGCGVPGEGEV